MDSDEDSALTKLVTPGKRKTLSTVRKKPSDCDEVLPNELIHLEDKQTSPSSVGGRGNMLCPLCDIYFPTVKKIEAHLVEYHGSEIVIEEREFPSYEDFKKWKQQEERQTNTRYNTRTSVSGYNYHIYQCHRSGSQRTVAKPIKRRRNPSEKLNRCCPARITTKAVGKKLKVVFHKTHFGHDEGKSLRLTDDQKKQYENMLENKVKIDKIFKEVRQNTQIETEVRLRTVLKRDEHLLKDVEPFSAYIVEIGKLQEWIVQQRGSLENCVLCYKTDTESCFHCFSLFAQGTDVTDLADKDEFVLILMTNRQRDEATKIYPKNVVLDCCRGVENGAYGIASLILLDDFGNACPIAFCVMSKIDVKNITHFFLTVKEAIGDISANVFMSMDVPEVYERWVQVMGTVKYRLLNSWDLDVQWQAQLSSIVEFGQMHRIEIYHACCSLLESTNVESFQEDLAEFLNMCSEYAETAEFGVSFGENFAKRPEQWALCYRNDHNFKNYKLELMHRRFQYCQRAGRGVNRPIEVCVNKLLQIGDEMMLLRVVQRLKKPVKIADAVALNHQGSKVITKNMITKKRDNVWLVETGGKVDTVSLTPEIHCKCQHACSLCMACIHQISCTCEAYLDDNQFCEHAHACISLQFSQRRDKRKMDFIGERKKKFAELKGILDSASATSRQLNADGRCVIYEEVKKLYDFVKTLPKATKCYE